MTQDQSASRNSGVYRWIEEACQAMRQNLNGARSYEERQATADKMLELLSGVPCPPEDLGFDSPADRAAVSERPLIPDEFAQIAKFYDVQDMVALVRVMDDRIGRLQAKLPPIRDTQPRRVREG